MSRPSDEQFMELLTRHQGRIFGYIFAAVRNLSDTEEIYQDTSLILWRKFAEYRPDSDFAQWACKTAKFEILHFFRAKRRHPICFSDKILTNLADVQAAPASAIADEEHQQWLSECVDELPPTDRELLDLCYDGHRTIKEVAELLQRSAQTLYNSLSRIRHALFDCIQRKRAEGGLPKTGGPLSFSVNENGIGPVAASKEEGNKR